MEPGSSFHNFLKSVTITCGFFVAYMLSSVNRLKIDMSNNVSLWAGEFKASIPLDIIFSIKGDAWTK